MKHRIRGCALGGALLLASAAGAAAQSNAQPATPAVPAIANRPVVIAPATPPARANLPPRPDRPLPQGQPAPAADVQDLVRDFQSARQAFIKEQQELSRKLATATEAERQAVRAQLKEKLQQWREFQKTQVLEMREQAQETLKNTRQDVAKEPQDGRGR